MTEHLATSNNMNEVRDEQYDFPASFAQQRLWFLDRLDPGSANYNITKTLHLTGPLDVEALENAFNDITHRHEVLRTHFEERDGEPVQVVSAKTFIPLPLVNLAEPPDQQRSVTIEAQLREEALQPFDLGQAPLMRVKLWQLYDIEYVLQINMHHIISDGWSMNILWHELSELYRAHRHAAPAPLPELPIQYADFAMWQRDRLQGDVLDVQLNYWKRQLADLATLELPLDRPRPAVLGYSGAQYPIRLSSTVSAALKRIGQITGTTLFMTTLTLFQVLLGRFSGSQDIAVGSPIAGRNRTEIEPLIGFFVNTIVLRADLSGNPSFREALKRTRDTCFDAYDHQELPFERLVEELLPTRDPSRHPLFQVMFTLQNTLDRALDLEGLTVKPVDVPSETARFDLVFSLNDTDEGLSGIFEYSTDLFDASSIGRMAESFVVLAQSAAADPDQPIDRLACLPAARRRQLLNDWNDTAVNFPAERRLHKMFEAQSERNAGAVAVVYEGQQLTYRELDEQANQLGHHLQSLGVGPDVLVGICAERSLEMVVAVLAVLKAGGAYVPLDPAYPKDRLAFMIADAHLSVLLTQARLIDNLPGHDARIVCLDSDWNSVALQPKTPPHSTTTDEHLAYVIYTSGSTGKPKGVMVSNCAISNHIYGIGRRYPLKAGEAVMLVTQLSFDPSVTSLFAPLIAGARLILPDPQRYLDNSYLARLIREQQVTMFLSVPSAIRLMLAEPTIGDCISIKHVFCGGETMPADLPQAFYSKLPNAALHNAYGPTEATIITTVWTCAADRPAATVPIGFPLDNVSLYVVDAHFHPVPIGAPGELLIGGAGLARGYLNRLELTAERFVAHPFSDQPGARAYRTGDLVRWSAHGALEYLGRIDNQVKIRGYRIELGEIESLLNDHPSIRESVVLAREDTPGDKRLVAYIVPRDGNQLPTEMLQPYLRTKLPDYMVPAMVVAMDRFPLNSNGKVDRKALPAPDPHQYVEERYTAPRSALEHSLAKIWCHILHIEKVGIHNNFFELGGHSLMVTRIVARLRSDFNVELPIRTFFAAPTIAELAMAVESLRKERTGTKPIAIGQRQDRDVSPLSFAQQRLWFLDRYEPDNVQYNIPVAWHLQGPLDRDALLRTLNTIVERHEILRTAFSDTDGGPVQVLAPQLALELPLIDLSSMESAQRSTEALRLSTAEASRPFDLTRAPLLRCALLRIEAQRHILMLTIHHIVSDGWSMGLLANEMELLYDAFCKKQESPLAPLDIQYADFALWQRNWLQGEVLREQLDYWKTRLKGAPPLLELPLDRIRPAVQSHEGDNVEAVLPPELMQALEAFALRQEATLFMVLLAAFKVLLHRYSGQTDIVVGSPIAGRNRAETENLIGFFVNTLALRTDLSADPAFPQLLSRVRDATIGAYDHQDLPFERLVEELQPERSLNHSPLFQVMFVLQNTPQEPLRLPGLSVTQVDSQSAIAKFDLLLTVEKTNRSHRASLGYCTALFDRATIERMMGHYRQLLEGIASDPQRPISILPLLTETERHQILVEWNATRSDYPRLSCIHQVFAAQAAQTPDKVAVVCADQHLTYAQLNTRANQLAHHLRRLGVGPDVLVGICMQRSPEMVVALLGILKAGGAYVPIDSGYPQERIAFMLQDSRIQVLLTQAALRNALPEHKAAVICLDSGWNAIAVESSADPHINTEAEHLAYINYTSGSTGKPKGVAIPHRGVMRLVFGSNYARLDADRVVLHMSTISFDASTFELWAPLLHGAKCVLLDEQMPTPENLKKTIARHKVDTMFITTALFNTIMDLDPSALAPVQQILTGGEAASAVHMEQALQRLPGTRLSNVYGPTECTTFATHYPLLKKQPSGASGIPIGKPIANTFTVVVDKCMQLLPVGVRGELLIGGDGLARGYLNRPELTAEKFIPNHINPEAGTHLYRTGDLVRYLPDGNIEFLDRIDQQVKIRGFRIETGEIETMLVRHPAVRQAVVVARQDLSADRRLVAYLTLDQNTAPSTNEMRAFVKSHLPAYMEPAAFIILDQLPLTPNGKVDRKALPAPDQSQAAAQVGATAPADNLELQLVKIWENKLNIGQVGVEDNFFDLGGHSLLAVRVISEINKITGQNLPVAALFHALTIRRLADIIKSKGWTSPWSWLVPIQPYGSKVPYFQVHGTVNVVHHLDPDQPYYELDYYGTDGGQRPVLKTVSEKAADFIREIRLIQPKGPYKLGGFCFGGLVAVEMAHQLEEQGEQVALLFLVDPSVPIDRRRADPSKPRASLTGIRAMLVAGINSLRSQAKNLKCRTCLATGRPLPEDLRRFYLSGLYQRAVRDHVPTPYADPVIICYSGAKQAAEVWKAFFTGKVDIHHIGSSHMALIEDPALIQLWAQRLNTRLCGMDAEMTLN